MTSNQIAMIIDLHRCIFLPGSFDKRFTRNLFACAENHPNAALTLKQSRYLAQLYHRYRRQIGAAQHGAYCELCCKQLEPR